MVRLEILCFLVSIVGPTRQSRQPAGGKEFLLLSFVLCLNSYLVHCVVEDDCAADGHSDLVFHKVGESSFVFIGPFMKERAVLEEFGRETLEVEAREGWVLLADKVLIEPVGLFDLEADALD